MSERSLQTYILPAEQAAILDRCFHPSGSFVEFPAADVEASIPARFEAMARLHGDRPALIAGARRVSYAELNRAANRLARAILTKCGPGSAPVALFFESAVSSIVAILAVLKAGKAYVPLDASYPQARLAAMLTDSQAQLVVSEKSLFPLLQAADSIRRPVLDIDAIDADLSDEDLGIAVAPSDYACMMYTSGSTGEPKGVIQNHRNILHKVLTHTNDYGICAEDRLSLLYSYAFSASVRCIFGALLNGAALVLLDIKREAMTRVAERIVEDRVTLYFSVPTLFRELAAALEGLRKPSSVRLIYPYVAPRTTMESEVAAIWAELLSLARVGIHDNFLELGGHSLAAARVISRVMEAFHTELPLTALFDGPTVAEMVALVVRKEASMAGAPELERMLNEVESITDEEARKSLAQAPKGKDGVREP